MLINVLDYGSVQAAFDAAGDGDNIYFPGDRVYPAPAGGWRITKSLEIYGDGPGNPGNYRGTVLAPATSNDRVLVVAPGTEIVSVYIHDLKIREAAGQSKGGYGILRDLASTGRIGSVRIERVTILNMTDAVTLQGIGSGDGAIASVLMIECNTVGCTGWGTILRDVLRATVVRSSAASNAGGGTRMEACGAALYESSFENNATATTGTQQHLLVVSCHVTRLDACHFESAAGAGAIAEEACAMQSCGGAAVVGACLFTTGFAAQGPQVGIAVSGMSGGPIMIMPNRFTRVDRLIDIATGVADCWVTSQLDDVGGSMIGGIVALPSGIEGLSGVTNLRRLNGPPGNEYSGLILPAAPGDPTQGVVDGMLYRISGESFEFVSPGNGGRC